MFVPVWIIVCVGLVLLVLLARVIGGRRGDMIERQRADSFEPGTDHLTVLAQPDVQAALAARRKIEAIKLVRERTGLGLKEAKQLVERQQRR